MAKSNEDDGITRWRHEGRVYRWQRPGSAWPGHITFVALRGGQVVLGDRYTDDGVERSYACEPRELLEGCFQELVTAQLGQGVLDELLAEVRHGLGEDERGQMRSSSPSPSRASAPASAADANTSPSPAREPDPAREPSATTGPKSPTAVGPKSSAATTVDSAQSEADRFDVAVVGCASVSVPLAVALRGITRASVRELAERLRALPCRVLAGVGPAEAERARVQLVAAGATVELRPAS